MTAELERRYRIGEVAELVGVTARTIRYYEELGLLGSGAKRTKGAHRAYGDADVARLRELIRLRDLLGLSLDELVELAEADEARAVLRDRWAESTSDEERARIVAAAIPLVERQLELVRARQQTLAETEADLAEKLEGLRRRRAELPAVEAQPGRTRQTAGGASSKPFSEASRGSARRPSSATSGSSSTDSVTTTSSPEEAATRRAARLTVEPK
ncbi:MAG TPA: MerR family transcriptional regulator [Gaiellaceae bacterium]|nr:MerR family transcriptional regulator [Gaiellaceae bacterium]